MRTIYIPHKLSVGDVTHLSDRDSDILINEDFIKLEDPLEINTPSGKYLGTVVFIDRASVEVEIMQQISQKGEIKGREDGLGEVTILQAAANDSKFNLFLEKAVELGVSRIYPVHSELCLMKFEKYQKKEGLWSKIVGDAITQSRTEYPPTLERLQSLGKLQLDQRDNEVRIALSTEPIDTGSIYDYVNEANAKKSFTIAVGPEKGWSSQDISDLRGLGFEFVNIKGNILRTETPALLLVSIIKYIQKAL